MCPSVSQWVPHIMVDLAKLSKVWVHGIMSCEELLKKKCWTDGDIGHYG